jgi:hypothetical protein
VLDTKSPIFGSGFLLYGGLGLGAVASASYR